MASCSAGLQRYFRIAKNYFALEFSAATSLTSDSTASSTSPSPRSIMPPDDWSGGSAHERTT
jgi:hypothetical protein